MNGEKESEEEKCSEEASPVFSLGVPPENEEPQEGDVERYENIPKEDTTCFRCPDSGTCKYAFDPYNTDGDCLADK
jgi:hypothetical protein